MVLVDFNGLAVGSIMGSLNRGEGLSESLVKHIIINNLRLYRKKYSEDKYGKIVICCDSRSWRKDVYPEYKANRKTGREKDKHDWAAIFDLIASTLDDLRENFPYPVIKIENAEADDIIGALTVHKACPMVGEDVVIISADKDFIQLQKHGHVIQWSPLFNKMVKDDNPTKYLFEHLLKGDTGDGVPNVLSPDNVLVDHIRQSPMTKKKMAEWWDAKDRLKEVMPQEVFRNYIRNREMIDLDRTPTDIKKESIDQYENYKYPNRQNILTYLIENRMKMLIENAGEF
jgi:5'-3' exonuclease|tara:strand:+ start:13544 stop:14401 length:858 start_codon:yes stop_codon:yes gene_type:complete